MFCKEVELKLTVLVLQIKAFGAKFPPTLIVPAFPVKVPEVRFPVTFNVPAPENVIGSAIFNGKLPFTVSVPVDIVMVMALFRLTVEAVRLFAPIAKVAVPLKLRILVTTIPPIVFVLFPDNVKPS